MCATKRYHLREALSVRTHLCSFLQWSIAGDAEAAGLGILPNMHGLEEERRRPCDSPSRLTDHGSLCGPAPSTVNPKRQPERRDDTRMTTAFPTAGMELTHILVVSDVNRSKEFYHDVLGAAVYREYGGTSCVLQFLGSWLLLVTGGGPTEDKPGTVFSAPADPNVVSHSITIRVPNCQEAYATLKSRGARFLTPPHNWGAEVRCFFRDPDGHLLEISEAKG